MRRFSPFLWSAIVLAVGLFSIMYPWFTQTGVPATIRSENVPEINYIWTIRNLMAAGHPLTAWNPSFLGGEAVLTHQVYPVYWVIAGFSLITHLPVEALYPSLIFVALLASGMAVAAYIWLLTQNQGAAILAGLVSMLIPGRLNTLEGLYIIVAWTFVTLALVLYEYAFVSRKKPPLLAQVGLGLSLGFMAWTSIQIMIMSSLLLGSYIVWRETEWGRGVRRLAKAEGRLALGERLRAWGLVIAFAFFIAASYYVPTLIELKQLGFSRFMGDPSGVNMAVSFPVELLTLRWSPAFTPTRFHHVTWYVGGFALLLALIGLIPKPKQWGVRLFWLIVAVASLLLVNGNNPFFSFIDSLPVLNGGLRRSYRYVVPFSLSLAVLAGLGAAQLGRWASRKGKLAAFVVPAVLILAVLIDYHPHYGSFRVLPGYLTADEEAVVAWLNQQGDDYRYIWPFNYELDEKGYLAGYNMAFAAHQIQMEGTWEDSYIGHFSPLPAVDLMGMTNVDHPLWRTDTVEPVDQLLALSNIRYMVLNIDSAPNAALFSTAANAGLPVLAEFGPMRILEIPGARSKYQIYYRATINESEGTVVQMADDLAQANQTQTVVIDAPLPAPLDLSSLGMGNLPSTDIIPTAEKPAQAMVDVDVDAPAVLVRAYGWFPGWRVTVDGEATPLLRVNHAYQGVLLEPGAHSVEFSYRPPWYVLLTSGLSVLALVVALAVAFPLLIVRLKGRRS